MSSKLNLTPVRRFFKLLELDRREIAYIYLYSIFAGVITLSLPLGIQAIIGLISGGAISSSLFILIGVVSVGIALTGSLTVMQLSVMETIQRRIFTRSSFDFAWRIPRFDMNAMLKSYPPELVNRFFDTLTIQKGVPKLLIDFSTAILQVIFGLLLLSFYHPIFVFFGVLLLVLLFLIFRFTGPQGLSTSLTESKYKYAVAHWLEEIARTVTTFKLEVYSDLPLERTDELASKYLDARKNHFRILLFQYRIIVIFKTVITGGLLVLGSWLVINNQISIGQFVAAEIVVILIMNSVEKLILSMDTIYDVLTALEKIGYITDIPLERKEGLDFTQVDSGKGLRLDIKDLYFKFEDAETPAIQNLSLSVNPGERICIAGYNGAGKSTLLQLLAGLFENYSGSIAYNDFSLRSIDPSTLRKAIGKYSTQEDIFQGTVYENITLGMKEVSLKDVVEVAQTIGLDAYIKKLPMGYKTDLLSGGRNIPESIRTKIILARSFVLRPKLLLLEDFLNDFQIDEKKNIAGCLTDSTNNWTLLAVSNDPMFAASCDRVVIMKEGTILMDGDFDAVKASPWYDQIFTGA
jgi:ABC-type bacteriocin/lantibiotic exporter with double-glycine peptidase domain